MPLFTLGQAAKAAGRSKATILDAIRAGRLTAPKDDRNRYQIDPAELFRVYPENRIDRTEPNTENQSRPPEPNAETAFLKGKLEGIAEHLRQVENERDDLRRRLNRSEEAREREAEERKAAAAEVRRLTLMLTHQPPAPEAKPEAQALPFLAVRWPFWLIALVVATTVVFWLWGYPLAALIFNH